MMFPHVTGESLYVIPCGYLLRQVPVRTDRQSDGNGSLFGSFSGDH